MEPVMNIEYQVRMGAAALFLITQAAQDFARGSVSLLFTLACGAAAFVLDCVRIAGTDIPLVTGYDMGLALLTAACLLVMAFLPGSGIGTGDGLSFLVLGLLTGPRESLMILFAALFLFLGICLPAWAAGRIGRDTAVPFLPFCAAACVITGIYRFLK